MSNTQADYSRFERKVQETKAQDSDELQAKGRNKAPNEASVIAMLCLACTRPASLIPRFSEAPKNRHEAYARSSIKESI
jgi:hypothetical protein